LGYENKAYYTERNPAHPGNEGADPTFDPEREFREPSRRGEEGGSLRVQMLPESALPHARRQDEI
ncbi:MAG: hypothetical protein ACK4N5_27495, partial [Myxococcales bacterium]